MIAEQEEQVRARAHAIWQQEGMPEGRAEEHWFQASEEVALESATPKTSARTGKPAAPSKAGPAAGKAKSAAKPKAASAKFEEASPRNGSSPKTATKPATRARKSAGGRAATRPLQ